MTAILMCLQKMSLVDKNVGTKFPLRTIFIRDADPGFLEHFHCYVQPRSALAWLFLTISHAASGAYMHRNSENVLVSRSRQGQLP
jgi:hypothetical protein